MKRGTIYSMLAMLALLCGMAAAPGCSRKGADSSTTDEPRRMPANLKASEKQLCESSAGFGLRLFREIVDAEPNSSNIFISPLSASMALGMTLNGAGGETRDSMQSTLQLTGLTLPEINESYQGLIDVLIHADDDVKFQIANSIWYREGLPVMTEFIDLNKTFFDALVTEMNFNDTAAADIINAWVNDNTLGKIPTIVQKPINWDIVMFLINAVYFKGAWTSEFDEELTRDTLFTLTDNSKVPCCMMYQEGNFASYHNDLFDVVDLPYGGGSFRMTLFLPGPEIDVNELAAQFTDANWAEWIGNLEEKHINLGLPRFKFDYKIKLNDVLEAMGMGIALSPGADFSNMIEGDEVWIDKVLQKAFIEVNEEGTEAAAATVVVVVVSIPPNVNFDRPFIFVIRENVSGAILFMGRVMEPVYN